MPSKRADLERKQVLLADNLAGRMPERQAVTAFDRLLERVASGAAIVIDAYRWSADGRHRESRPDVITVDELARSLSAQAINAAFGDESMPSRKDMARQAEQVLYARVGTAFKSLVQAIRQRDLVMRKEGMRLEDYEAAMDNVKQATWEERR